METRGNPSANRLTTYLPLILILIFTAVLYSNTFDNKLTYWDDNRYVTENPRVKDLSLSGVIDIFDPRDITRDRDITLTEYLPLTTLVHAVAYHFGGLHPAGYHTANLLLYLIDIALLYWFLMLLTGSNAISLLSTLVFSVLTVHVESVTWVAATKDVLSFVFLLGAFILYIRYVRAGEKRSLLYAGSVVVFALGMLAKTLVVTLPVLLMLHDLCFEKKRIKVIDKVPYFVIGALLSYLYVQVNKGFVEIEYMTRGIGYFRLALLNLTVFTEYIGSFFAPLKLNVFYTYTPEMVPSTFFDPKVICSFIVVAGLASAGVYAYFKNARLVTFSIFWFFIAFIPVINIIPSSTVRADRYLFIPSVGLSLLTVWAAARLYNSGAAMKRAVPVVFIAWLVFLSILTYQRNGAWQSGVTIWLDSLTKYPETPRPHFVLGNEYRHRSMTGEAIREYEEAMRLSPAHPLACANLGGLYGMTGRYYDAVVLLKGCLETSPGNIAMRLNLARAYISLGEKSGAETELMEVLKRDPGNPAAEKLLGFL
jgi:tetratricopeptide (TPR) repeat protein